MLAVVDVVVRWCFGIKSWMEMYERVDSGGLNYFGERWMEGRREECRTRACYMSGG